MQSFKGLGQTMCPKSGNQRDIPEEGTPELRAGGGDEFQLRERPVQRH